MKFTKYSKYRQAYLQLSYKCYNFKDGFLTTCDDPDLIAGNSMYLKQATYSVACLPFLLTKCDPTQLLIEVDELELADECHYLLYRQFKRIKKTTTNVRIKKVDTHNFKQYVMLSEQLQVQEYGKVFAKNTQANYLKQDNYVHYLIKIGSVDVGEFTFYPKLNSIEAAIIDKDWQNKGIMSIVLNELLPSLMSYCYLSCDQQMLDYYLKNGFMIVDSANLNVIYGDGRSIARFIKQLKMHKY